MFQLVFRGECTPGTDPATARDNARTLFKATAEQVEKMFSGKPVVIRNRLDQDQAEKYRVILHKHGMVAYVQAMAGTAGEEKPASKPPSDTARPGPARQQAEQVQQVQQVEPGDRLPVAGEKVDSILAGSGLSLDPAGVTLVEPREVEPPMFQHLDDWSLAPPGSDLGVERDLPPPRVPDVSHLSLADEDDQGKS